MIVEIAQFNIVPGQQAAFEKAWQDASRILNRQIGHRSHRIGPQSEDAARYVLQVEWNNLAAHKRFMAHEDFKPFIATFWPFLAGQPELMHFAPLPMQIY